MEINDINSRSEVPSGAPPGFGVTCNVCSPTPASESPCGHSPTFVLGATGASGASASGVHNPLVVSGAVIGGNGICHCIHVTELITKVEKLEAKAQWNKDPWDKSGGAEYGGAGRSAGNGAPAGAFSADYGGPSGSAGNGATSVVPNGFELPLRLNSTLGSVGCKDRPIFDQKMTLQDEFKFNGTKDAYK